MVFGVGVSPFGPSDPTVSPPQRPGSIVVEHEIYFTMMETNNMTETFEATTRMVVQRLQETQAAQGDCQHNTCG